MSSLSRIPVHITRTTLPTPLPGAGPTSPTTTQNFTGPAPAPAPAPLPPIIPAEDVLQHVQGLGFARLQARVNVAPGDLTLPGTYGPANVRVEPGTTCDLDVVLATHGGNVQPAGGQATFCKPLKITNPVKAFVEPVGLWCVGKPLVGWAASYYIDQITLNGGNPHVNGSVHVLHGIRSRRLDAYAAAEADKTIARSKATQQGPMGMSPEATLQLLQEASPNPVPFTITAAGTLPDPLRVDAGGDNFICLPGGPIAVSLTGTVQLGAGGSFALSVPGAGTNGVVFAAHALQAQLAATLVGTLYGQNGKMHAKGSGSARVVVNRAAFEVRPKENPTDGGIDIIAGDIRQDPSRPAVVAPLLFAFHDTAVRVNGDAQVNAAATFLNPGEPPPTPGDESSALDMKGNLAFQVDATGPKPQFQADGTVFLAPPGSDPFAYKVKMTPEGSSFDLVTE